MANFCKYCGKPLENGVCDCEAFKNANPAPAAPETPVTPVTPVAPAPAPQEYQQAPQGYQQAPQGYQQAPQGYQQNPYVQQPQAPSATAIRAKGIFESCKTMFLSVIKTPDEAIKVNDAQPDKVPGLVMGGVQLLLFFLLTMIHIPVIGEFLETGDRAKIGLLFMLMALIGIIVVTVVSFIFGKKKNPTQTFVGVLSNFCVATIPGTALFLISFIMGFIALSIAILCFLGCFFTWILFSQEAVNTCMKGSHTSVWVNLLSIVIGFVVIYIIAYSQAESALSDIMGGLNSLGSFF